MPGPAPNRQNSAFIVDQLRGLTSVSIGKLAYPLVLAAFDGCLGEHSARALALLGEILSEREFEQ